MLALALCIYNYFTENFALSLKWFAFRKQIIWIWTKVGTAKPCLIWRVELKKMWFKFSKWLTLRIRSWTNIFLRSKNFSAKKVSFNVSLIKINQTNLTSLEQWHAQKGLRWQVSLILGITPSNAHVNRNERLHFSETWFQDIKICLNAS